LLKSNSDCKLECFYISFDSFCLIQAFQEWPMFVQLPLYYLMLSVLTSFLSSVSFQSSWFIYYFPQSKPQLFQEFKWCNKLISLPMLGQKILRWSFLYLLPYLKNLASTLHEIFRNLSLWLGPPLMTVQYVMYFQFCGCGHVCPQLARQRWGQWDVYSKWLTRGQIWGQSLRLPCCQKFLTEQCSECGQVLLPLLGRFLHFLSPLIFEEKPLR